MSLDNDLYVLICTDSIPQDMYGYSRKSVTVMLESLDGALDLKEYVFHAHRHSAGRKTLATKKPKAPKKSENSAWAKLWL